jgi:hypothetical protein
MINHLEAACKVAWCTIGDDTRWEDTAESRRDVFRQAIQAAMNAFGRR